jgi:hypothetical protein
MIKLLSCIELHGTDKEKKAELLKYGIGFRDAGLIIDFLKRSKKQDNVNSPKSKEK